MSNLFRIHGDNIIECERIAAIIINETNPSHISRSLISSSTISIEMEFRYLGCSFSWKLELLPGFNKSGRRRWFGNIFDALKNNGSFLDETPDAIITEVNGQDEIILCAIEFCSALQAGNQSWQRSGRAFSTGRTGCPYLYIVDFVKYELDSKSRQRKALRFPNPAVPYSYINFSKEIGNFVAQIYVRSEEFDKDFDRALRYFDEDNFADRELAIYIVKLMCGFDTADEESEILRKNFEVVTFLAKSSRPSANYTVRQWKELYESGCDIVDYSLGNAGFNFHKTITAKGHHGKSAEVLDLIDGLSVGLASRDLPFGIIPAANRESLARGLQHLYPSFDISTIHKIATGKSNLILCLIKGFKPRGDDNRPDRGILPLAVMLSNTDIEIMTYIYGPVIENNFNLLLSAPERLAASNGLWKSILALSNYMVLDVPILTRGSRDDRDEELLLDTNDLKEYFTSYEYDPNGLTRPVFSSVSREFHEDDVDTGIHFVFAHLMREVCFEGMCNPPGGDWSGLSVLYGDHEVRWLSLPRVSEEVNGKRPDHVLEIFGAFEKPVLLAVESKERAIDLESVVGDGLVNYLVHLMDYIPSVERCAFPDVGDWQISEQSVDVDGYEIISAAAYLRSAALPPARVFQNSNCDMLFVLEPVDCGWDIEIIPNTRRATILKDYIIQIVHNTSDGSISIH